MAKIKEQISQFSLVGQLIGFIFKGGVKLKYLRIVAAEREYWIQLPKPLRKNLDPAIAPGCWLEIQGYRKRSLKTGKVKFNAESVELSKRSSSPSLTLACDSPKRASKATAKILVCQKSDCRKRGAQKVCQALTANLEKLGLAEEVEIKLTGCLKECKKGPNLVVMPDKARYSRVRTQQIPELVTQHFRSNSKLGGNGI